jgi:hypothetical protein
MRRIVSLEPAIAATRSRAPLEILTCGLGLSIIAVVMCSGHVSRGGFYYDDWSVLALGRFPSPGGLLHGLWLDYGQRPGQVLYYAALDEALGAHAPPRLAFAAATLVLEATCLYALLRRVGLAARDSFAIAGLSLAFPFSDSVWLWGILSLASLALAASLLGVILALRALESSALRALALHTASLALYVTSLLSYEVFAVAGCFAGLLYVRSVGLARARARWALDVLAILTTLLIARVALPVDVATPSRIQSFVGMISHAGLIASEGVRVSGEAAIVGAAALRRRLPSGDPVRTELGRWLAIAGVGALVAIAGWAVYLPASDHYSPSAPNTVNRMNLAAAIGIVLVLYSCLALLVRMFTRLARWSESTAALAVMAAALALGVLFVGRTVSDAHAWDAAASDQRRLLSDLHATLPRLPPNATIYAFDAPRLVGPGIPVLNTKLDLTSAARLSYAAPELLGVPVAGSSSMVCGPRGPQAAGVSSAYGEAYIVDVGARRAARPLNRAQCLIARALPAAPPQRPQHSRRAASARPSGAARAGRWRCSPAPGTATSRRSRWSAARPIP